MATLARKGSTIVKLVRERNERQSIKEKLPDTSANPKAGS